MSKAIKRIPLYKQIEQYIYDQIRLHDWKAHQKLPSETELAALFDVSRLTVKNALLNSMDKGLVYRIQGKGSFISDQAEHALYEAGRADSNEKIVALVVPLAKTMRSLHLINGIEEELSKHGYRLLLCKTFNSKEKEKQVLQEVLRLNAAGIIVYPAEGETYSEEILKLAMQPYPLVIVDRYLRGIETNCVYAANEKGAYDAASHLIQLGHTKIGFLSTQLQDTSSIEDRLAGYEQALADFHLPVEYRLRRTHFRLDQVHNLITDGMIEESVKDEIRQFIRQNPDMTAIFAVNSVLGLSVIEIALEMGIRVPDRLSVCFFDDFEFSVLSKMPPTCVQQQEFLMGEEAAKLVVSLIRNPKQERRRAEIPTKLVIRSSTAPKGGRQ